MLLLLFILTGGTGLYYYKTHYITAQYTPKKQTEITGQLQRPDCGWYQLYSYYLRPNTDLTQDELYIEETDEDGNSYDLSLLEFNLAEYRNTQIDTTGLKNIRQVFERFSHTNAKTIIRFLYDWEGFGKEKEPERREMIETHMKQLGPVLNRYKNSIFTTQGIFVGSWAEMHNSNFLSPKDMTCLLLTFADATDSSIFLAVRTPSHYRTVFEELEKHPKRYEKYSTGKEELKKRLGLYNDGLLGSISDIGTYHEADIAADEKEAKKIRQQELSFQNKICQNVPNGGECVRVNPYNDGDNAIQDFAYMHISYLNRCYDEAVIEKWKTTRYKNADSIYDGVSIYEYITCHLGARMVLKESTISYRPFQKGDAKGTVTIENTGFSNLYHKNTFTLYLVNESTGQKTEIYCSENESPDLAPVKWDSGKTITIPFSFSPFALQDGTYHLIACLTDNRNRTVSFANDSDTDNNTAYELGSLTISR